MMPIADAHVSLSQNRYSLADYLEAPTQFHVLRMVSVQQPQSTKIGQQELDYLQTQATTRGSGGLPNGIVASVDLSKPELLAGLVVPHKPANVRGICYGFEGDSTGVEMPDCLQSMDILNSESLSLDVTASVQHVQQVGTLAQHQPSTDIIVSVFNSFESDNAEGWLATFASLAKHDNVSLKLCGIGAQMPVTISIFSSLLVNAIDQFGHERIMFASGIAQREDAHLYDKLWSTYDAACSKLSARQRDNMFRQNTIRVYKL